MFPLNSKAFPQSASDFERALDESLRRYVRKEGEVVTVSSRVFPYLDHININLDDAELDSQFPDFVPLAGETKQVCEAAVLTVSARNVRIQGVPISLRMEVRDVVFHHGEDHGDGAILLVQNAREGHVVVSAAQLDIENAIAEMAASQAKKHGVSIENVRLALRARGARSIAGNVRLQAKKLFFRANIDIVGQFDITDDFVAKASHMKCKGDGAVGSLACGVLEPHLRRLEGQTFPLLSLPMGEIQLRDIRIAVADTVDVTADFGTAES